jgi:hypothetical protein
MVVCEQMAFTNWAMAYSGRWRAISASLTIPTSRWFSITGKSADLMFLHDVEHLLNTGPGVDTIGVALGQLTRGNGIGVAARRDAFDDDVPVGDHSM